MSAHLCTHLGVYHNTCSKLIALCEFQPGHHVHYFLAHHHSYGMSIDLSISVKICSVRVVLGMREVDKNTLICQENSFAIV